MYSRYHNAEVKSVQLPENYSGCAFTQPKSSYSESKPISREHFSPPDVHRMEIAKPTLPKEPQKDTSPEDLPPRNELQKPPDQDCETEASLPTAASPASFLGNLGKHLPFSGGLGFEELLLLGLILLLSQTDQSSDVVLWLALLLFCG